MSEPQSTSNTALKPPQAPKTILGKLVENLQLALGLLALLVLSPFIIDYLCMKFEKDIPKTWVSGWKRIRASAWCIIGLFGIVLVRRKFPDGWTPFLCDALFITIALKGLFLNLWDLAIFVLIPRTPGITHSEGSTLLDKTEKGCRELLVTLGKQFFPDVKDDWALSKVVSGIVDFGFDLGRKYVEEILIRSTLVYLSFRYALLLLFLNMVFAGAYDWIALVSSEAFTSAAPHRTIVDFVFFSTDILTTSSISGVAASSHLAKATAAFQLGLGFLSLVFFIPLIFVSYDRALSMREEIRKTQDKHMMKGAAEFIAAKTGVPFEDARKLLMGELTEAKAEKIGIKIDKALKDESAKPASAPKGENA
jgi:hypothetical protein